MSTYCLDLYVSILWNYSKDRVSDMFVAWSKVVRRLWKLPNTTHCKLLSTINSSFPIEIALEKRCAKFIHSCLNSNNLIIKTTSISAITTHRSQFGDNYRYICYKYKIPRNLWFLQIGNILQYIQDFILKYVCTSPEGAMIRELCLQRDNDDLILSNSELSSLIDGLCVNYTTCITNVTLGNYLQLIIKCS